MLLLGTLKVFHILKQFTWEYSGRVRIYLAFVKWEKADFKSKDEKGNHHNASWSILERVQLQADSLKTVQVWITDLELECPLENMGNQFETCCPLHKILLLLVLSFISVLDTWIISINFKPLSRKMSPSEMASPATVWSQRHPPQLIGPGVASDLTITNL